MTRQGQNVESMLHFYAHLKHQEISQAGNLVSFNPYSPNVTFLYSLKTWENRRFSDVFRGYRNVTLGEYGLTKFPRIERSENHKVTLCYGIIHLKRTQNFLKN